MNLLQKFYYYISLTSSSLLILLLICHQGSIAGHNDNRVLPRFASLRANEVNWRRGPGKQYPTDWIYMRAGLPIEIIAEFDVWRQVRDCEGTEGWTHQSMLSGRRNIIVIRDKAKLYKQAEDETQQVTAIVRKNAIGQLVECKINMCKIQFENHKGWLKRQDIWGVKAGELKFK